MVLIYDYTIGYKKGSTCATLYSLISDYTRGYKNGSTYATLCISIFD